MEKQFQKAAGYSLLTGSVLMVLTMVLHPSGGSIEHIRKISSIAMLSHSIAVSSLPFVAFGFYALSVRLYTPSRLSMLAFMIICQGLVATMMAATINGLTLPLFVMRYASEPGQDVESLEPVIHYGFLISKPMGYIFIGAVTVAMGIWSGLILRMRVFPKWVGYYGLFLVLLASLGLLLQVDVLRVASFRIFIFGIVSWTVWVGYGMIRRSDSPASL